MKTAVYCRVSTESSAQESSVEGQRQHFLRLIESHPDWELADIYLEAASGTNKVNRPELKRLLTDCASGKIDLIITKSISRFARNLTDCLEMVRMLTALGISIYFEKENIHTESMESELMLSLLAGFAEEESRSISESVKWGIRKRFADGSYRMPHAPFGYRKEGGMLHIVPEEAEIVRNIFQEINSGTSPDAAAKKLNENTDGNIRWSGARIRKMVRNPVYTGDMLYQKTYTDAQFRQQKNRGEVGQFLYKDHHEAIVSREMFALADQKIRSRCGRSDNKQERNIFSGKVFCAECGRPMYRITSGKQPVFRCASRIRKISDCSQANMMESEIKKAFLNALNHLNELKNKGDNEFSVMKTAGSSVQSKDTLIIEEEMRGLYAAALTDGWSAELQQKMGKLEKEKAMLLKKRRSDDSITDLRALTIYLEQWKDREVFSEDAFCRFVKMAVVCSGKWVRFHFCCGLVWTEPGGMDRSLQNR